MKNENINAIIDANGVSDRWFTRLLTLALAGIAASVLFGALISPQGRAQVAALVSVR